MEQNKIPAVDDIRKALADRNLQAVARNTGISQSTLYKITQGKRDDDIRFETYKRLVKYLFGIE